MCFYSYFVSHWSAISPIASPSCCVLFSPKPDPHQSCCKWLPHCILCCQTWGHVHSQSGFHQYSGLNGRLSWDAPYSDWAAGPPAPLLTDLNVPIAITKADGVVSSRLWVLWWYTDLNIFGVYSNSSYILQSAQWNQACGEQNDFFSTSSASLDRNGFPPSYRWAGQKKERTQPPPLFLFFLVRFCQINELVNNPTRTPWLKR